MVCQIVLQYSKITARYNQSSCLFKLDLSVILDLFFFLAYKTYLTVVKTFLLDENVRQTSFSMQVDSAKQFAPQRQSSSIPLYLFAVLHPGSSSRVAESLSSPSSSKSNYK